MEENPIIDFLKNAYVKFLDTSQTILFFVAILLVLYMFVVQPHQVSGSSMFPTFKDQELMLSNLLDVKMHSLRYGDVVVFHAPKEDDKLFIKRIIGFPGDTIELQNGFVFRNGKKLDESEYLQPTIATYGGSFLRENTTITVPPENLFVMGDNRPYSSDSRAWGYVPYDKLIGRTMLRFWPPQKFEIVPRDPYNK